MIRKENGFGLIGLAVTIAIAAIIAAGAGMTSIQIIRGTERNEEQSTVTQQAHNLGRWFSRDAPMAGNITAGDDPETGDDEEILTIYWKDWENGDYYDIRYILLDYGDSLKKVQRKQVTYDKDGVIISNITSMMADSIYSAELSQQDDTWILDVETHSGEKSSIQEYRVVRRLG